MGSLSFLFYQNSKPKRNKKILAFIWNMCYHTKAVA